MLDQVGGMWAYSTQQWMRHVIPTKDTNQSRWEESDVWAAGPVGDLRVCDATPLALAEESRAGCGTGEGGIRGLCHELGGA